MCSIRIFSDSWFNTSDKFAFLWTPDLCTSIGPCLFGDIFDDSAFYWTLFTAYQPDFVMSRTRYTPQEYANMHYIYGECIGNATAAAALYRERYPNARHPDYRVFIRVHRCYSEGIIPSQGSGGGRMRDPDVEDTVLGMIDEDPSISMRDIQRRTGIPRTTAHGIVKKHKFHPYHVTRVQTLQARDYPERIVFCREMLARLERDPDFFNKILWSDESTCKRDGYLNLHNLHSWQLTNPRLAREDRSQYQFKINYWTGILNGKIIGPFELPGNLNGAHYLHFLQNELPRLLEEVPLAIRRRMWLQNDGCPAHYAVQVRNYQNESYPNRWIGRLGPILWPPRSPDLNPLDFFYWGCLKEKVYKKPITTIEDLRQRVQEAAQQISEKNYNRVLKRSFMKRCRACIRVGGGQFEHLL